MAQDDEEDQLGAPVAELALLSEEPTDGFLARVRAAIERRRLGSDATSLAWHGVIVVVLELLAVLFSATGLSGDRSSTKDGPGPTA